MRRVFRFIGLLVIGICLVVGQWSPVDAQGQRLVLVHYYVWWSRGVMGPGVSPDWPVELYDSWDPAVIARHVQQAASANIDGMVVGWYGPQVENNQTETNFRMVLDQASANGIHALASVDLGRADWFTSSQEIIDSLNYLLSVHANHPAYLRYNGRPVVFFWFQGRYSVADWQYIRAQVDPDHNSIWFAEGAALNMLPTFDGLYLYTISWSDNVYGTLAQWANSTRAAGGVWAATAMPGWDNTYTQQSERYIRDREGGAFYRDTFAAAAATNPDMVVITSWNEWLEGTHIEPSAAYGDFYLNLTRELASTYKASGAVAGGGATGSSPATPTSGPALVVGTAPASTVTTSEAFAPAPPLETPTLSPIPSTPSISPSTVTPTETFTPTSVSIVLPTLTPQATAMPEAAPSVSVERLAWGVGIASGVIGLLMLAGLGVWRLREK